ncbi:hypothetical protein CANCADRAFT_137150 [Tortispora caseinolytica NRRL Y-17796]|uniref:C2H2-type domain-containing protein n=1 Tax=Tortispora caseinolytica NRRL Y-17796 TaxID=767744 RepID=A0A1E4TC12_9ASCO|nr:hypothetical protein CANCADRAFT_137150 [Tortispora caseinolytica NRRL Y-17796]
MTAAISIAASEKTRRKLLPRGASPFSSPSPFSSLPLSSPSEKMSSLSKQLIRRRISEGDSGRLKEELKCDACGKGYKHISCLTKHLWEHTPEWAMTSSLPLSKHQQVQLLEAASILVSMTDEHSYDEAVSSSVPSLIRDGSSDVADADFDDVDMDLDENEGEPAFFGQMD